MAVSTDRGERIVPNLFLDLRQGPDDEEPLIHLDLDETPIARFRLDDAAAAGSLLIEPARLAGGER